MSAQDEEITAPNRVAIEEAIPLAGEIVSNVLNLSARRVMPLVGMGSVNLIYFVETNVPDGVRGPEIVVRMNKPEDDAAKMRGEYEKERWCIAQAQTAGVPGPDVMAVGEMSGRAYMLQTRVPGVNGKQSDLPPEELFRILGHYARLIHALPCDGFGDSIAGFEGGGAQEGWLRFVDYNLGELTQRDPLIALGVYAPNQQDAIRTAFQWLRSLSLRVGLTHGDLARRNTIVDETGHVVLLDWGCAEMNIVPHYELNALLSWYKPDNTNLRAFLDGYGMTEDEWTALLPELDAFMLLKAFDLTRWAIDRCPTRIEEIAARAREAVQRFL